MTKKMVLDVDGVLLDFIQAFEATAKSMEAELGQKISVNPTAYQLTKRLGITQEQEDLIWKRFAQSGQWEKLTPLPGVVEAIDAINKAGFDIYVVTAIEEIFKNQRLVNLTHIGVNPKEIHCVGYGKDKGEIIKEINPDVFIDDRLEHLHNANIAYHLVWLQDEVEQHNIKEDAGVDVSVKSLKEWVDNHMPAVVEALETSKKTKIPLQRNLRWI